MRAACLRKSQDLKPCWGLRNTPKRRAESPAWPCGERAAAIPPEKGGLGQLPTDPREPSFQAPSGSDSVYREGSGLRRGSPLQGRLHGTVLCGLDTRQAGWSSQYARNLLGRTSTDHTRGPLPISFPLTRLAGIKRFSQGRNFRVF